MLIPLNNWCITHVSRRASKWRMTVNNKGYQGGNYRVIIVVHGFPDRYFKSNHICLLCARVLQWNGDSTNLLSLQFTIYKNRKAAYSKKHQLKTINIR